MRGLQGWNDLLFSPLLPLQPLFKVNVQMPTSFPWIISHCGSLPRPLSVWPANEPGVVGSARRACLIRCSLRQRRSADDGDEDGHEEEEGEIRLSREKRFRGPFCPACGHASVLPVREEHFSPLLLFTHRRHFVLCWPPHTRQLVKRGQQEDRSTDVRWRGWGLRFASRPV